MSHPLGILGGMDRITEVAERQHCLIGGEQAPAYGMTRDRSTHDSAQGGGRCARARQRPGHGPHHHPATRAGAGGNRSTRPARYGSLQNHPGRPESELEALLLAVLRGAQIAQPDKQGWVGGTKAPAGRVDFVWREAKVVIEATVGSTPAWLDVQADHRRDLLLTAAGWRIIRVNWHQLIGEPELVVAAVRAFVGPVAA